MKHLLLLLFALFSACAESQNTDSKNLPESKYAISHSSIENYRDWFTVRLNNDSIICSTEYGRFSLDSIGEIEGIYCQEWKKYLDQIAPKLWRLYPKIEADSFTRYELIDQTIEILKHIQLSKFFFRTRDEPDKVSGFWLVFPVLQDAVKPYLAGLYGQHIISEHSLRDCLGEIPSPPPPPPGAPPPPPPPNKGTVEFLLPLQEIKSAIASGNYGKFVTIEISNGKLYLNKKETAYSQLAEAVQQPDSGYEFYIMLGRQNTYGEFIKILDLLYSSIEPLQNAVAQREFGKNYSELDGQSKFDIRDEVALKFSIITLSEQMYLNDK